MSADQHGDVRALQADMRNMTDWQHRQDKRMDAQDGRLSRIEWWLIGAFTSSTGGLLLLVLNLLGRR